VRRRSWNRNQTVAGLTRVLSPSPTRRARSLRRDTHVEVCGAVLSDAGSIPAASTRTQITQRFVYKRRWVFFFSIIGWGNYPFDTGTRRRGGCVPPACGQFLSPGNPVRAYPSRALAACNGATGNMLPTLSLDIRLLRTGMLSGTIPEQLLDHPPPFLHDRMVLADGAADRRGGLCTREPAHWWGSPGARGGGAGPRRTVIPRGRGTACRYPRPLPPLPGSRVGL